MRIDVHLGCSICKTKGYVTSRNKQNTPDKFKMKKFCKKCRKHTEHKEVKG